MIVLSSGTRLLFRLPLFLTTTFYEYFVTVVMCSKKTMASVDAWLCRLSVQKFLFILVLFSLVMVWLSYRELMTFSPRVAARHGLVAVHLRQRLEVRHRRSSGLAHKQRL